MVEVVAGEPIVDRRLRADGLQGRVGVDHAAVGVKAGIGNAPLADFAVVILDVLDQPVDGVVGIGAFVEILRPLVRIDAGAC